MLHVNPSPNTKHAPRPPIALRAWTPVQRELHRLGISQRMIADAANVPASTVNRALSLRFAQRVRFGDVLRVRRAIEYALATCGAKLDEPWAPYDTAVFEQ